MSRRRTQDLSIIKTAIAQQKVQNERACAELDTQLRDAQRRTFGSLAPPTAVVTRPPVDEITARRLELANSKWASEVVLAAVLDDTFMTEVGKRAHQLLVEKKLIPADEPPQPTPTPTPVTNTSTEPPLEGGLDQ